MAARIRNAVRLAHWSEQDHLDATCTITAAAIAQARRGACSPQHDLARAAAPYDAAIVDRHPELAALIAAIRARGVTSALDLRRPPYDLDWTYKALAVPYRELVQRAVGWPRCWLPVLARLTDDAWLEHARSSPSLSTFIETGGGWWLRARKPALFMRVRDTTAALWDLLLGADGYRYDSLPEVLAANLFLRNADRVGYEPHPLLPFAGLASTRKTQRCRADFRLLPRPGVACRHPEGFFVEMWMLPPDADGERRSSAKGRGYLPRRADKTARYRDHGIPFASVECETYRANPRADVFLAYVRDTVRTQTGLLLATDQVVMPIPAADRALRLSIEEIAQLFRARGVRSMSEGLAVADARLRLLAQRVRADKRRLELDTALATAFERGVRNDPRSAAERAALRPSVEAYVRTHGLTKAAYTALFQRRALPPGFPASPRGAFAGWSWREVKAPARSVS